MELIGSFDPLTSLLSYRVSFAKPAAAALDAVVIRRSDAAGIRVLKRVLGPGMTSATGSLRLLGADLDAFHAGRVTLALFTVAGVAPVAEVRLQPR